MADLRNEPQASPAAGRFSNADSTLKMSLDDGLRAVEATALAVKQSKRLTPSQEAMISKSFDLIREDATSLNARIQKEKNRRRALQAYTVLRGVRDMLGLQGFLLCALALTPTQIRSMTEANAVDFPYYLKRWWEESSPSSERLEMIAQKLEPVDAQIEYIPLADEAERIMGLT